MLTEQDTDLVGTAECHQESLNCYISRTMVFSISLGSWPPKQSQTWLQSHGMVLKSSQILLVTPTTFVTLLCCVMLISYHYRLMICSWVHVCLHPLVSSMVKLFSGGGGGSSQAPAHLPIINKTCRCYLQQWGLTVNLWRAKQPWQKPELFGEFHGVPIVNNFVRQV